MTHDIMLRLQAGSINELWTKVKELEETLFTFNSLDELGDDPILKSSKGVPIGRVVVVREEQRED